MGLDVAGFVAEFRDFLGDASLPDDMGAWRHILGGGGTSETATDEDAVSPIGIRPSHISDQPTAADMLGFEPYVKAIADFLRHEKTKPPVTLSIEGEWGCGKSSFMLQLEQEICGVRKDTGPPQAGCAARARDAARRLVKLELSLSSLKAYFGKARAWVVRRITGPRDCEEFTVRFNAWRHDKEDAVWAAFALEFLEQIKQQRCCLGRWMAYWRLCRARYSFETGSLALVRFVAAWLFLISLSLSALVIVWHEGPDAISMLAAELTGESGADRTPHVG